MARSRRSRAVWRGTRARVVVVCVVYSWAVHATSGMQHACLGFRIDWRPLVPSYKVPTAYLTCLSHEAVILVGRGRTAVQHPGIRICSPVSHVNIALHCVELFSVACPSTRVLGPSGKLEPSVLELSVQPPPASIGLGNSGRRSLTSTPLIECCLGPVTRFCFLESFPKP